VFIAGVSVGALTALLYASKSGEELRVELAQEARADQGRLQQEYARAVDEAHELILG
jgi:gas vesicle protein